MKCIRWFLAVLALIPAVALAGGDSTFFGSVPNPSKPSVHSSGH